MVDAVYGEIVGRARLRGGWRTRARTLLVATYAAVLERELVTDLLGARPTWALPPGPAGDVDRDAQGGARNPEGEPDAAWVALHAVTEFFVGALRREVADRRAATAGHGKPEWETRMAPYLGRVPDDGHFSTLRELVVRRATRTRLRAFVRTRHRAVRSRGPVLNHR